MPVHVELRHDLVAATLDLAETLTRDWQKPAWFYTRFGRDAEASEPVSGVRRLI